MSPLKFELFKLVLWLPIFIIGVFLTQWGLREVFGLIIIVWSANIANLKRGEMEI